MKIRLKLVLYFGLLLLICFGLAILITRIFLANALDRLGYSNLQATNESLVDSMDGSSFETLVLDVDKVHDVTKAEIIVMSGGAVLYTTFEEGLPNLSSASLVSDDFSVYQVTFQNTTYFFTIETVQGTSYRICFLRHEGASLSDARVYYAAFIGIIFLVFSVTTVSFFTTRTFTKPIQELADYANRLEPEAPFEPRPVFTTEEFNELGLALEKASIRLREYHQSEQEFLHNFSHEMKTPLTNIYGYAEAMHYEVLSPEEKKAASQIIMNESEKLKNTINQILLLGHLDSLHSPFTMQKNNLVDVINDALGQVAIEAKEAGIALEFPNAEEDHYFVCDADKMETAFVNLLSNGIRYAKTAVVVRLRQTPEQLTISIDDDGPGIPEGEQTKVFERFYTGFKGHTGLGLTITKSIVEHHGGTIRVGTNEAHGARFILAFLRKTPEIPIKSGKENDR